MTQILDNGEQIQIGSYVAEPVSLDLLKGQPEEINYSKFVLSPPKANHLVNGGFTTYKTTIIELKINLHVENPGRFGPAKTVKLSSWDGPKIKEVPIDPETGIARIEVPQGTITPFTTINVSGVLDSGGIRDAPTFYIGD